MSMEKSFIRGCFYYYTNNSIWYIYRARMANYVIGLSLRSAIMLTNAALAEERAA